MSRCACHIRIFFSDQQEQALDALTEWVREHGVDNLSHRLTHSGPKEARVYNQCSWYFGKSKPNDLTHLSALAVACHYAAIEYKPGMLRSTTVEDDLDEVLRLYDAGEMLTESTMKKHSRLRSRLKRRLGDTWFSVFERIRELRPDVEFRRFFGNAPDGVFVDLDGQITLCETKEQIAAFASRVFGDYVKQYPETRSIAQIIGEGPAELRILHLRLWDQSMDARVLIEKATGRTFPVYAMKHHRLVPTHNLGDAGHPPLASFSELVVDAALAETISGYAQRHRHQVAFKELAPGPHDWASSPYTGNRGPVVDLLVDGRLVIEVSFATERRNPSYVDKMKWKLAKLEEIGMPTLNVKIEDGAKANAKRLAAALGDVGIVVDEARIAEVLWSAAFEVGTKDIKRALAS